MSDFEEIKKELLQCRLCENIFPHEPRPIFQGNPHAKIFQISQAPSIHVHESGLPFNDASGYEGSDHKNQIRQRIQYIK